LSTIFNRTRQIAISLDDKDYADAFVEAEITTTLPFQLKAMRKQRGWKQQDVANRLGHGNQKTVSDFENPNYAKYTLTSLKRLASVFDVALIVRFAPYSEVVDWAANLSHRDMAVPERTKDRRLQKQREGMAKDVEHTTPPRLARADSC
jgi:transcriptional regulator with XRE-family HTH domain